VIAAVLLGLGTALSLLIAGLRDVRLPRWVPVGLMTVLVAGAGLATALGSHLTGRPHAAFVVVGLVVAGVAGSQVATAVFEAIDEHDLDTGESDEPDHSDGQDSLGHRPDPEDGLRSAGLVLRGGAWIGFLERVAVFAALIGRWPEGIAIVLAVKGLGRYPELRSRRSPGLAERFIIGTLVSVLWAALCAYTASGPALG
jgi:hypothetical protein